MFPNDNAFLTEQYKTYRLQLVQLPDGDISDFRLNKYKVHLLFLTQVEYPELEKAKKNFYTTKSVRLDVYLKDVDKIMDVELQC